MPTVQDIYAQTIKPLTEIERMELVGLLMDDLAPEPPSTVRSLDHLESLLLEGMDSPRRAVTDETWQEAHAELDRRLKTPSL